MSKMPSCRLGMGNGKSPTMNILMIVVYLVIAYVIYNIVMYIVGYRQSAMPNIPASHSNSKSPGSCSTGTCGGK